MADAAAAVVVTRAVAVAVGLHVVIHGLLWLEHYCKTLLRWMPRAIHGTNGRCCCCGYVCSPQLAMQKRPWRPAI